MSPWLALLAAGVLEVVWATALKLTAGFSRPAPVVVVVLAAGGSFLLLGLALRDLPMSIAYAIWTGIGAIGVAVLGIVWFDEPWSPLRVACLLTISIAMVVLHLDHGSY